MNQYINPRNKLLHHLDRLDALQQGRSVAPVNVEIDLSNRCSLGCEWCHFGYTHTRGPLAGERDKPTAAIPGGDLMDSDLAIRFLPELDAAGVRSITWTGGGEPTLHPDFDHIVKYVAWDTKMDQGMYTNGGHINPERAATIKKYMTWCYVSLDCADRESYIAEKRVDRFHKACDGVRNLAAADGTATIGVGFLVHALNYHRVYDMRRLALDLGADYAQFRPAVYFDINHPGANSDEVAWIDPALRELRELSKFPQVQIEFERFNMLRDWQGHGYQTCYWAGLQTCITPDGSVWTCVNKREHSGERLGSVADESFAAIWKRGGVKPVNEACRVLCRGHVPNLALQEIMRDVPHVNFI